MAISLKLSVVRMLDDRLTTPEDAALAKELHQKRAQALHDIFDYREDVRVINWGDTDDVTAHEGVDLLLSAIAVPVLQHVVVPGVKFIGEKLAEKAVDEGTSSLVKSLVSWLRPKQESKKVFDFVIQLPDGSTVKVNPPDGVGAHVVITFKGSGTVSCNYGEDC